MAYERNPVDSHKDIYPWPFTWSKDINGTVISALALYKGIYPRLDYWTYDYHWSPAREGSIWPSDLTTDLYYSDDDEERGQMPFPIGDHLVSLLTNIDRDNIRLILWRGEQWTKTDGWTDWHGEQGEFVTHIHVQWERPSGYVDHLPENWPGPWLSVR